MRTLVIGILLILISSKSIYSQKEYDDNTFAPFWEMYSSNYLNGISSGKGNTGIASESGISGAFINPASFKQKNKFDLNVQYTVKTIQPYSAIYFASDWELRQNWLFSGSVGLGYKVNKNLQVGLVYSNPASFLFSYGTTTFYPTYGSSSEIDEYSRIHAHQFSIPVSYSFGKFNLGLDLSYSILIDDMHGLFTTITEPDGTGEGESISRVNRFSAQLGAIYNLSDFVSIGATVRPGVKNTVHYDDANPAPLPNNDIFVSKLPWRAGVGFEYRFPNSDIKIDGDYYYEHTSVIDGFKDKFDLNLGAEFPINKKFTVRTGFFTLMDERTNTTNSEWTVAFNQYQQYFLTLGGTINFKNADLTASLLDSHMSPGTIKNTYLNTSFSYHF